MSSIQSPNLFLLVGFLYWLLSNRIWPVKGMRSRCNTFKSKRCYGNNNATVRLYSLSFDIRGVFQKYAERFHRMFAIAARLMIFHVKHAWYMLI